MQNNIPAVLAIMEHIYNTIIYAELNTKSDLCEVCGFDGEIKIVEENGKLVWECPNCGCRDQNKMHVTRRTCGKRPSIATNQNGRNSTKPETDDAAGNVEPSLFTDSKIKQFPFRCDICGRPLKRKIRAYGVTYCGKHYKQVKKYGHVLDSNPRTLLDKNDYHIHGNVTTIDLYDKNCEKVAEVLIDTEDLDRVKHTKWKLSSSGYAMNTPKYKGSNQHMSRVILGTDHFVDHINHNTLDNRKCNLRVVTKSQNQMNSDYKGVTKTNTGKYYAHIKLNQKMLNLGVYVDQNEAYYARWYAETLLFKEYRFNKDEPKILEVRKTQIQEYVDKKVQRL